MFGRSYSLGLASLLLVGCAVPEDIEADTSASDLVGRVDGSTIASPNANAGATYLTARHIDSLEQVGALDGTLDGLAHRVDGIIANKPADGRFSIDELLQIEKPGYVETLFPEEKAALPGLWKLLETTKAAAQPVAVTAPSAFAAVDVSTPAGALVEPASLPIASLPADTQLSVKRLELTQNADGDATTVSKADLASAIATPGPYTPSDITAFQKVLDLFAARAGTALDARVEVPAPGSTQADVATLGTAKLSLSESLAYEETRSAWLNGNAPAGSVDVRISAHHQWQASLALVGDQKAIVIDETSEAEHVATSGAFQADAGAVTVEIWSGGTRTGSYRLALPKIASVDERVDLSSYADYTFVAGGAPLVRNVVSASTQYSSWYNQYYGSQHSTTYNASFTYDLAAAAPTGAVDPQGLAGVATPALPAIPGRYEVTAGAAGVVDVDLYPQGVVRVTRASGQSMRTHLYHWDPQTKWDVDFPDRFRVILDPSGGLEIFFDGQGTLFSGPITTATRKG